MCFWTYTLVAETVFLRLFRKYFWYCCLNEDSFQFLFQYLKRSLQMIFDKHSSHGNFTEIRILLYLFSKWHMQLFFPNFFNPQIFEVLTRFFFPNLIFCKVSKVQHYRQIFVVLTRFFFSKFNFLQAFKSATLPANTRDPLSITVAFR